MWLPVPLIKKLECKSALHKAIASYSFLLHLHHHAIYKFIKGQ